MTETAKAATNIHSYTLVFSLYGQYVLPREEGVWVGTLIRALAPLGYSAGAVRAMVSRMQRKGYLQGRRIGRHSFYRLTERGLKEVRRGGDRAFAASDDVHEERWTVVTYSVPERQRRQRDLLRDCLKWWGFGALAPGTWISPRMLRAEEEAKLRRLGVWEYLEIFRGTHLGPSDAHTLVAHAWPQLEHVAGRYRAYLVRYEPVLRRCEAGELDDEGCFATQLLSLCQFVAITLEDPALPPPLLPEDWPRPAAQALFKGLQHALSEPAACFFEAVCIFPGGTHA